MVINVMDLLYSGRFDGFCIVSSDSDFTRLAARIRESGLTVYGFGERKPPKSFVAACDTFIYIENLGYAESGTAPVGEALKPAPRAAATRLKRDTAWSAQGRNAVEAASDDDGWAALASVGQIITNQSLDFDSRSYGYAKLSDLMAATTLFDLERAARATASLGSSTHAIRAATRPGNPDAPRRDHEPAFPRSAMTRRG